MTLPIDHQLQQLKNGFIHLINLFVPNTNLNVFLGFIFTEILICLSHNQC